MDNNITTSPTTSAYYSGNGNTIGQFITIDGTATINSPWVVSSVGVSTGKKGINAILAFKYIKKNLGLLEKSIVANRLKKLEKAFNEAVDNGQEALGEKLLGEIGREARETMLYAKGIRYFIERKDIAKVKHSLRDGHISDTRLENYTRVIPKDVLAKKKKVDGAFDGYVIYHYYNPELEEKRAKDQKMTEKEKADMRDPILFGWIKECDRLYFVADWEDEYCDLTFEEMVDLLGETKLTKNPKLNIS